jgi:hypothetical protein
MSAETAQTILFTITAVATVIWFVGLWFLVASCRTGRTEQPADHFRHFEQVPQQYMLGTVEVGGQPGSLVEKLDALLVRHTSGSVKILEKTKDRLAFEWLGPVRARAQPQLGQLRFTSLGSGRTRIDYAIEITAFRWLLWLGGLFLALGLAALVGGGWVIYEYCLPSPEPQTRAQAIQIAQVAHFLWPPFLFCGLYRQKKRLVKEGFEMLLRNLSFFTDRETMGEESEQ